MCLDVKKQMGNTVISLFVEISGQVASKRGREASGTLIFQPCGRSAADWSEGTKPSPCPVLSRKDSLQIERSR